MKKWKTSLQEILGFIITWTWSIDIHETEWASSGWSHALHFKTSISKLCVWCINCAVVTILLINYAAVSKLKITRNYSYPYAQLFPEPCFWQKHECWPYFHRPEWAAFDSVWLITLGSMSTSTARAIGTREGKKSKEKYCTWLIWVNSEHKLLGPKKKKSKIEDRKNFPSA